MEMERLPRDMGKDGLPDIEELWYCEEHDTIRDECKGRVKIGWVQHTVPQSTKEIEK
jgi:hypothetical protein